MNNVDNDAYGRDDRDGVSTIQAMGQHCLGNTSNMARSSSDGGMGYNGELGLSDDSSAELKPQRAGRKTTRRKPAVSPAKKKPKRAYTKRCDKKPSSSPVKCSRSRVTVKGGRSPGCVSPVRACSEHRFDAQNSGDTGHMTSGYCPDAQNAPDTPFNAPTDCPEISDDMVQYYSLMRKYRSDKTSFDELMKRLSDQEAYRSFWQQHQENEASQRDKQMKMMYTMRMKKKLRTMEFKYRKCILQERYQNRKREKLLRRAIQPDTLVTECPVTPQVQANYYAPPSPQHQYCGRMKNPCGMPASGRGCKPAGNRSTNNNNANSSSQFDGGYNNTFNDHDDTEDNHRSNGIHPTGQYNDRHSGQTSTEVNHRSDSKRTSGQYDEQYDGRYDTSVNRADSKHHSGQYNDQRDDQYDTTADRTDHHHHRRPSKYYGYTEHTSGRHRP